MGCRLQWFPRPREMAHGAAKRKRPYHWEEKKSCRYKRFHAWNIVAWKFHARKFHIFVHENEIFMHESDISMHENENVAPGMIFSPQKCSWAVGLYTNSCMEFTLMKIFVQNFHFHAWKFHFHAKFHYAWTFSFRASIVDTLRMQVLPVEMHEVISWSLAAVNSFTIITLYQMNCFST